MADDQSDGRPTPDQGRSSSGCCQCRHASGLASLPRSTRVAFGLAAPLSHCQALMPSESWSARRWARSPRPRSRSRGRRGGRAGARVAASRAALALRHSHAPVLAGQRPMAVGDARCMRVLATSRRGLLSRCLTRPPRRPRREKLCPRKVLCATRDPPCQRLPNARTLWHGVVSQPHLQRSSSPARCNQSMAQTAAQRGGPLGIATRRRLHAARQKGIESAACYSQRALN